MAGTRGQKMEALDRAREARALITDLRRAIRDGKVDIHALLLGTDAEWEPVVKRMKVRAFLRAIPGIGESRCERLLYASGLYGSWSIATLDEATRRRLAEDVKAILELA